MKSIIRWLVKPQYPQTENLSLIILVLRLFAGLMMIPYGWGKIVKYDQYVVDFFGDPIGIGMLPSLWLTIFAQVGCSVFLLVGFQTRISSLILAFNMLIAVKYHFFDPFSVKALPMLFLGLYLVLLLLGGGKYTIDTALFNLQKKENGLSIARDEKRKVVFIIAAFSLLTVVFTNCLSGLLSVFMIIAAGVLLFFSFFPCRIEKSDSK